MVNTSLLQNGFYAASLSTFHLLYIVTLGILAKKFKIIDDSFQKNLSKVVTNVILPCFIFAQIVNNFRIENYQLIFDSLFGCCFLFFFGLLMGWIIAKFLRNSPCQARFIEAVFSTPHTTSMTIVLMQVIGPLLDSIIPRQKGLIGNSEKRGYLYIAMNSIYSNIWRWSGAYYLIDEEDLVDHRIEGNEEVETRKSQAPERTIGDFFKSVVNVPLVASILSILFTLNPYFQSYFNTPGSLLNATLISVNVMVGKSYGFIVMFLLGLSFADSIKFPGDKKSDNKGIEVSFLNNCDLFWISVMKLIVMPLLACPLIIWIFRDYLQSDDVLVFIFLFMASAPSAINIIVICTYKDLYVQAVSLLMIVMYAAAIITLTLQVTFFVYIIAYLNIPQISTTAPVI